MEKRAGNFTVEKVDQRAHEKGSQNRSDTNKSGDRGHFAAAQQE